MKWYTKENVTQDDLARAVSEAMGWALGTLPADGSIPDPVPVLIPMSSLGYIGHMGSAPNSTPLADVLNWLNQDSEAYDPLSLGI